MYSISVLHITAILFGLLAHFIGYSITFASTDTPIFDEIDIGPYIRRMSFPIDGERPTVAPRTASTAQADSYGVGDQLIWLSYDSYCGKFFPTTYTVRAINTHSEIWVQDDLGYKNLDNCFSYNLTENPIHPDKNSPDYVTQGAIEYLGVIFDQLIWPTGVGYFGGYEARDGTDGQEALNDLSEVDMSDGQRIVILVSNIRDANFYFPAENPSFIAGFYSPNYLHMADRNMITIDSRRWHQRMGFYTNRFSYEATIIHEFQHLIHYDADPSEELWVNEGLSEYAEFLAGFRTSTNHGRQQWQLWPENSLTLWNDQIDDLGGIEVLADYQHAYLFMLYTAGRLGGDNAAIANMAKLASRPFSGVAEFNRWIAELNPNFTFESLYSDFRIHMLHGGSTDDPLPNLQWNANYIGSYASPLMNANGPRTLPFYLGGLRDNLDSQGYSTPGVPLYGTDYLEIGYSSAITLGQQIRFQGEAASSAAQWEVNFVTYEDGDERAIRKIYPLSITDTLILSSSMPVGTLNIGAIAGTDPGFNEAGERGILLITSNPSVSTNSVSHYNYNLTNVPPSLLTSDALVVGSSVDSSFLVPAIYPGGLLTHTIHIDNLGTSPDITVTAPITVHACATIPDHTLLNAGSKTAGSFFTVDMSLVAATFPAESGICYSGLVTRTHDFSYTMSASEAVTTGSAILLPTYFASDITPIPEQREAITNFVLVRSPFSLSSHNIYTDTLAATDPFSITTSLVNLDYQSRAVRLTLSLPDGTQFASIEPNDGFNLILNEQSITVEGAIAPFETAGVQEFTLVLQPKEALLTESQLTQTAIIEEPANAGKIVFEVAAAVDVKRLFLPFVERGE